MNAAAKTRPLRQPLTRPFDGGSVEAVDHYGPAVLTVVETAVSEVEVFALTITQNGVSRKIDLKVTDLEAAKVQARQAVQFNGGKAKVTLGRTWKPVWFLTSAEAAKLASVESAFEQECEAAFS